MDSPGPKLAPVYRRPFRVADEEVPRASSEFRRKAWRDFQRALDPLARPEPLRRPS